MRIAFCIEHYFLYGGLQRDFFKIATLCYERGHQIDVFTMDWQYEQPAGWTIYQLGRLGLQNHVHSYKFSQQLKKYLNKKSYDIVVGFNKTPNLDFYFAGDPCYKELIHKTKSFWNYLNPRYKMYSSLEEKVLNNSKTKIFCLTPQQAESFEKYYPGSRKKIILLPPGVEKTRCANHDAEKIRADFRKKLGRTEKDFILLALGSGFKSKGLDRTLRAIASLKTKKNIYLYVLGEGPISTFKRCAKKLGIEQHVYFMNGQNNVPEWLQTADLLIHPAYVELAGHVLIESIVAGLGVITTDVCGYAEYIKQAKSGIVLHSPFSQTQLNKTLEVILNNKSLRDIWRKNGIHFGRTNQLYDMHEKAVEILEKSYLKK